MERQKGMERQVCISNIILGTVKKLYINTIFGNIWKNANVKCQSTIMSDNSTVIFLGDWCKLLCSLVI